MAGVDVLHIPGQKLLGPAARIEQAEDDGAVALGRGRGDELLHLIHLKGRLDVLVRFGQANALHGAAFEQLLVDAEVEEGLQGAGRGVHAVGFPALVLEGDEVGAQQGGGDFVEGKDILFAGKARKMTDSFAVKFEGFGGEIAGLAVEQEDV